MTSSVWNGIFYGHYTYALNTKQAKYSTEMQQNISFCVELNVKHASEGSMPLR